MMVVGKTSNKNLDIVTPQAVFNRKINIDLHSARNIYMFIILKNVMLSNWVSLIL